MKNGITINIDKKAVLIMSTIVGIYSFADFVSIIDTKSTGGINVTGGITESQLTEAIETVTADYESQITALTEIVNKNTPIGTIQLWGNSNIPEGWLELNGDSVPSQYTELSSLIGGTLPDFRGQFVRGWDNGAGIDSESSRTLFSTQEDAIRNITGNFGNIVYQVNIPGGTGTGAFTAKTGIQGVAYTIGAAYDVNDGSNNDGISFDASNVVPTADENRPKNITAIYIIKAE